MCFSVFLLLFLVLRVRTCNLCVLATDLPVVRATEDSVVGLEKDATWVPVVEGLNAARFVDDVVNIGTAASHWGGGGVELRVEVEDLVVAALLVVTEVGLAVGAT
jgi:hypothetical protein